MRPQNLKTKIFLNSADPDETANTIRALGFLDGQTTNPTLVSKNLLMRGWHHGGAAATRDEILHLLRGIIEEIERHIPNRHISVQVLPEKNPSPEELVSQAQAMHAWISNAYIKLPITKEGICAAVRLIQEGIRVNMTLCFSQEQAAAIYSATRGATPGSVVISPFVGRLCERGENGMDLVANIVRMFEATDKHCVVLAANVLNLEQFLHAIQVGSDAVTAQPRILKEWGEKNCPLLQEECVTKLDPNLKSIEYKHLDLSSSWPTFDIGHELTDAGINRFSEDWNSVIKMG